MCGIAGYVSTRQEAANRGLLQAMNDALVHRGPDDEGAYLSPPGAGRSVAALAMRRLSIIDLASGHQPIGNEDESLWIVFNGEVYNHEELRRELEGLGHRFRTRSDTEAILHAYEQWGEGCLKRLRGMFAFAIWNERDERLFVARDGVGIKPLYWTETGDRLLFASEIKSLLRDPAVPRRVNREGLHHYLTYLYVPPPQTMFEGIRQLPPGHFLTWQRGRASVHEWWVGPEAMLSGDAGDPVSNAEVWDALKESVNAHLLADVPLGAFLSGGIDSTLIVALMAEQVKKVQTFSIGFSNAGLYDETPHARMIAQHFGTDHHEFYVAPDAVQMLPEILRHLDEPLADASVIPNYFVAKMAREHVTVALTGIGGDELFGGYRRYFGDSLARKWRRIPRAVRRGALLPALRLVPASGDNRLGDTSRLMQKFLEPLDLDPERRYLAWNAFFTEAMKGKLYQGNPSAGESAGVMLPHFDRVAHRPFADRAMFVDIKSYLPGDPLFLSDRMTMANSLEARVPFVDPKVMELAARIPLSQKLQGQRTKAILRDVLGGKVPEEILRRPKQGFGTPIDLWLRKDLAGMADHLLSPKVLNERGYFDPTYVQWLREQQATGRQDFSQHLWALLAFELWHRAFIDSDFSVKQGLTFDDLGLRQVTPPSSPSVKRELSPAPTPSAPQLQAEPKTARPLRILLAADVDPVHVIGGAERMLNEHSVRLAAMGHQVTVLTRRENAEYPAEEVHQGVRVVRHPVESGGTLSFFRSVLRAGGAAFARLHRDAPFDVLNVHQPLAAASVLGRPESRDVPVLYTYLSPWSDEYRTRAVRKLKARGPARVAAHAWLHVNTRMRQRVERDAVNRADRLLVLSDFSASQLREIHGVRDERIVRIPGGVDTERFRPPVDRLALRRELGLPEGLVLFTVRNLVPRMGLDNLIAAMREVVDARPEVTLVIGGTGALRPKLEEDVARLGLKDRVRFAGFIAEERLPDYYGAADLFVLPTLMLEGFGLVTVEALACGTPVVGTPVGGTQEILRGFDDSCLFTDPGAAAIAARILEKLPQIEAEGDALSQRCREHVLRTYAWDVLVPQVSDLLTELVHARKA